MKRVLPLTICVLAIFLLFPITARADIGPKPSVVVDFKGLEGKVYYFTLLSKEESTGPYSIFDEEILERNKQTEKNETYDIFLKFVEYKDEDGFYFIQFLGEGTQTHKLIWDYYPPQEFKILVYFPEENSFVSSGQSYSTYAFDSYYTAAFSSGGISARQAENTPIQVEESYDYTKEIISLVLRILLTIAIELWVALLFGFREKKLVGFILLVNLFTQVALNVVLNIINFKMGSWTFVFYYVLLEMLVFAIEGIVYSVSIRKFSPQKIPVWKPWAYAFVANLTSFVIGICIAIWLPAIF